MSVSENGTDPFTLRGMLRYWRLSVEAMWWTAKRYWPATVLGILLLIADSTGNVEPTGAGMGAFLGWFLMYTLVAHDRALNQQTDSGGSESDGGDADAE